MNDKTRREFLKSCFRIGGYAAIANLGMGAVEDARGWGPVPAIVIGGSGGAGNWVDDWDELDQVGWGDSDNSLICLHDSLVLGGDDTASGGGKSGADLVFTQVGNVPAALGPPYYRAIDDTLNQGFNVTLACSNLLTGPVFTLVMKIADLGNGQYPIYFSNGAGKSAIFEKDGSNRLLFYYNAENATTTDAIPAGTAYLYMGADGGKHKVRAGFSASRVKSWDSIPAGQKATLATEVGGVAAGLWSSERDFYWTAAGGLGSTCNAYYIIMSQSQLLTD